MRKRKLKFSISLAIIIALNFIVFVFKDYFHDMFTYNIQLITEQHQYVRIITSMFLHMGTAHFFANMAGVLIVGYILFHKTNEKTFLVVYLAGGILGGVLETVYSYYIAGDYTKLAVGASGAVFAVLGALVITELFKKEYYEAVVWIGYTGISLYLASKTDNVDNCGHITGLIGGIVVIFVIILSKRLKNNKKSDRIIS